MTQTDAGVDVAPSRSSNYRPHLDGLRAVAVYLVVAFHARLAGFAGGFIGVDVFFVLSGYLVTSILLRDLGTGGRVDLRRFYARRFRRILPAAAVALLVTAVAYAIVATPAQMLDALGGFRAAFLYVANWHFISQATDYFAPAVSASPVLHFWSLAVEEQFYFVWPLLLSGLYFACLHRGGTAAGRDGEQTLGWWLLRAIVAAAALASVIEAVHIGRTNIDRAYYGTDTRAYQLLAGALLALTPQLFALATKFAKAARALAPVALVGLVVVGSSVFGASPIKRGVFAAALTFALIAALDGSRTGVVRDWLSDSRVAYLGRISYATYLWHWPLIVLITHDHAMNTVELFVIATVGSTLLAALSYQVLEQPVRSWRVLDRYRTQVIAVGLSISLVCGVVVAPAILRWNTGSSASAGKASISAPKIHTGKVTLLDWRVARNDIPALPDCFHEPIAKCTVVHGKGASIVLIGDSLARMWLPAFTVIARRESLTLTIAAFPSCPWQPTIKNGLTMSPPCPDHRADWYTRIIPQLHPDIVVVAERGYDELGNAFSVPAPGGEVPAASAAGQQALISATRLGLQSLQAPGRKIVLLQPTPLPPKLSFEPVSCLSTGSTHCRVPRQHRAHVVREVPARGRQPARRDEPRPRSARLSAVSRV